MPNWVQLVTFTAEYTPGPWEVHPRPQGPESLLFIRAANAPVGQKTLGAFLHSWGWAESAVEGEAPPHDPEQQANARLACDAPDMLALLAQWANAVLYPLTGDDVGIEVLKQIKGDTENLLRRHVRIGCVPVDAESRAAPPIPCSPDEMEQWLRGPRE